MKKILVTGGAGFIGSHLCEELLKRGNEVICLDNLFTGNKKNIEHLLNKPNFKLVEHDIENAYDYQVDEIYNLACPAAPVWYQKDAIRTIKTNIFGAINVLELARKNKCRVLFTSTSEVYGDPEVHPQKESYYGNVNPIGLRSCYDEGKRCAESLFFNYHRQYGVDIKVVRIFNTYGPRTAVNDGRVISNFIVQALEGQDITIFGDGSQTRSFCYVSDMVDGLIKMMESNGFTGPVNLGNPEEYKIIELAQKIIDLSGSKSKIIYKELPADDPTRRKPDIALAREYLTWQPTVKLDDGLKSTIEYFKNYLVLK